MMRKTERLGAVSLACVLIIAFVLAVPNAVSASQPTDPPAHVYLTWARNDTASTITITWKTAMENAGDVVRYGTEPGGYGPPVVGSNHTYSGAGGYIHDVELTGLSPNTNYYFICGGENGGWSSERSFQTAPETSTNIRFVAGGDSRSGAGDWPLGRDSISRTMAKFNPSFVLFTGDFTFNWNNQAEWDNWFAAAQEYWVDNDGLTIPIIPCIGNHEVYYPQPSDYDPGTQATNYYGQFSLPGNERWYSLDWGPDLHIIVLDSEIRSMSSAWEEQLSWLEDDLAAHASYRWKIAIFHRPAFSSGRYGSDWLTKGDFVPLFDNYHVDLVFSGHDHNYQRTYPINYNISENTPMPSPENGTVYMVVAGWGAPLYSGSPVWWTAYGPDSRYNFCVLDIFENGLLRLSAVDGDGNVFDEFSIQKTVPEVVVEGISPLVIGAVAAAVTCAAVAFYLLKIRR
jgi:hypothetical protein